MYPIPSTESLVQTKTCRHCQTPFPITDKDLEFYEKISPTFHGKKYSIPAPTLCPDCRQQRRLSFRNERKLYKRKCDATGQDIISIYSPDKPFKVYNQEFWWSDKWNPMDYGRDFDFSRPFFEQFGELMSEVPMCQLTSEYLQQENCDYTNSSGPWKNCYMSFEWAFCENAHFSKNVWNSKNIMDCSYCDTIENSYQCIDSNNCFNCKYLFQCDGCANSERLFYCKNCEFCTNCSWLENKKYHINNVECWSLENYQKTLKSIVFNKLAIPHSENGRFYWNEKVEKAFNVINSKNCYTVKDSWNLENCKYCEWIFDSKDCYDFYSWGENVALGYELQESWRNVYNSVFLWLCWGEVSNSCHSFYCWMNSSHLFWCIGLRNKSYCILNKQYTKEEYEALVPKIIEHMMKTGEWGEFFPSSLSPFGYNETVAMEYYPLDRRDVVNNVSEELPRPAGTPSFQKGNIFNWSDYEAPFPKVEKIIPADKLPDDITKIPDDILNWAIECEVTKKPFRIIKQELEFYRKHNLPIPRRHPDQRHLDRMALRNPRKLFERKCDKCGVEMVTTYGPERKEIVYCESCYEKEVMG